MSAYVHSCGSGRRRRIRIQKTPRFVRIGGGRKNERETEERVSCTIIIIRDKREKQRIFFGRSMEGGGGIEKMTRENLRSSPPPLLAPADREREERRKGEKKERGTKTNIRPHDICI